VGGVAGHAARHPRSQRFAIAGQPTPRWIRARTLPLQAYDISASPGRHARKYFLVEVDRGGIVGGNAAISVARSYRRAESLIRLTIPVARRDRYD
jgi:hypothetical protein